jgi:predicted phage-related endonuclease
MKSNGLPRSLTHRRRFIGGSDARIIMGTDEAALLRLWQEKRGEIEPEDLSGNLVVQLGVVTEGLNRLWYERNTGQVVTAVQRRVEHPVIRFLAATLDGIVEGTGAVFESKFMLPWSFSEEAAAQKYIAQLQHNMWVTNARSAALSIITGRQVGRAYHPGGFALPASPAHGREEVLALHRIGRASSPVPGRTAARTH